MTRVRALCLTMAVVAGGLLLVGDGRASDAAIAVGRLHPLIVHFPVALLVLAAAAEVASATVRPLRALRRATGLLLLLGAASAVVAAGAGTLLARDGGYDDTLLTLHRRLGVTLAITASLAALLHHEAWRRRSAPWRRGARAMLFATALLLVVAAHEGGSLTHGPAFLTEHLPAPIATLAGAERSRIADADSARIYDDLVAPILARRCTGCHGESKAKGGLRLHTTEAIFKGGEDGPVVVAGDPEESDLLRRITLPPGHEDAMPPGAQRPLDVGETEVIRWWIANGASTTRRVGEVEGVPTAVATHLARVAAPREARRGGLYAVDAPAADPRAVETLRRTGLVVEPVAEDLSLLQVTAVNVRQSLGDAGLRALGPVAPQVTWLDLAGTRVGDGGLATIARLPNLTRLSLAGTAVSDSGLRALAGLTRLEYLNLYGTGIGDSGLASLKALPALRVVYLWETRVTPEGRARLEADRPGLRVFGGAATPSP